MIDVNTPEGRKALKEIVSNPTMRQCDEDGVWVKVSRQLVDETRAAVPALLDALEESEADVAELRALDAEAQIGADEQTKQLHALQSENAALRARVEALEKVREAAEAWANKDHGAFDEQDGTYYCVVCSSHIPILGEAAAHATHCPVTALRAALSGCPPVAKGE